MNDKKTYEYTVVGTKSLEGMMKAIGDHADLGWEVLNFSAMWKVMAPPIGESIFFVLFKREIKSEIIKK